MPETATEVKPEVAKVEPVVVKTEPVEDIVSRVSKFKPEEPKPEVKNEFGLTQDDYEKVKNDPTLSKFYKSLESGAGKKFQEAAELKKNYERKMQELDIWTPEKVKSLLNKQDFVESAKKVAQDQNPPNSGVSDETWSAMSEAEKQRIKSLESKVSSLELQNHLSQMRQQDEKLKGKYANYDPQAVDIITQDLLTGKAQATREELWKVYDYENAVRRAYELGKQDKQEVTNGKVNASSFEGKTVAAQTNPIEALPKESDRSYFGRIVLNNLTKYGTKKQ